MKPCRELGDSFEVIFLTIAICVGFAGLGWVISLFQ